MFRNLRFGIKIGGGFALLLVLLVFVAGMGFNGLRLVRARIAGMAAAKDVSISILEARREEKNFILRGGQDYIDKVSAAVAGINASAKTLKSGGLTAGQGKMLDTIEKATTDYAAAFSSYVTVFFRSSDTAAKWKDQGDQLVGGLDAADRGVDEQFLLLRISAVYLLKDRTDDRWKAFQAAAAAFTPRMKQWVEGGKNGDRNKVAGLYAAYLDSGTRLYKLWGTQAALDTTLVDAGRRVIDGATALENELETDMNRTAALSILLMLVSAGTALILGILLSLILTTGITGPLRKGVEFAQLVAGGDFSRRLDIRQADEVGVLAQALNGMSARLREMVATI
jgi:methyl-accepting chemotaxis protein